MNATFFVLCLVNIAALLLAENRHLCNSESPSKSVNINGALQDIIKNATEMAITFCNQNYIISDLLVFRRKTMVSLAGSSSRTILKCSRVGAGIRFEHTNIITLKNFTLKNCSAVFKVLYRSSGSAKGNIAKLKFFTAIGILSSKQVHVDKIEVFDSRGTGLAMAYCDNNITVKNSVFENSHNRGKDSGGGGMYIYIRCTYECSFNVIISSCTFRNNSLYYDGHPRNNSISGIGNGGGLNIFLENVTNRSNITIVNCTMDGNTAHYWGGGMTVLLKKSSNMIILIDHCNFTKNTARRKGGGGVDIGYLYGDICPKENRILFNNSRFEANSAKFGGGVYVFCTAKTCIVYKNVILFKNCSWIKNQASYAASIYAVPQLITYNRDVNLPLLQFTNCKFLNNMVYDYNLKFSKSPILNHTKASFYSVVFRIFFISSITFEGNSGTALYLVSSTVEVRSNCTVNFYGNSGHYGGAVALYGSSTLNLRKNIYLNFVNNTAFIKGGAIYQESSNSLDHIAKTNCFIHYIDKGYSRNITFRFLNNHIVDSNNEVQNCSDCGRSVFLYSIYSCARITKFQLNSLVNFTFENSSASFEISTQGKLTTTKNYVKAVLRVIPGKPVQLPIKVLNDYGVQIKRLIQVVITNYDNYSNIKTDSSATHIFNENAVTLLGKPGSMGNISLSLSSAIDSEIRLSVKILECPPGYIYKHLEEICFCSINTNSDKYVGISHCDSRSFQALLKRSFWIGYQEENNSEVYGKEDNLYSAQCPTRYCTIISTNDQLLLPNTSNVSVLDRLICGSHRTGIMCAECRDNNSVYYHTENFDCSPSHLCKLGWLFYILSELFPVTILFVLITLFNIQLTSGNVQGFILYAQMFNTLLITANGQIFLKDSSYTALQALQFIYRMFDLEFFTNNKLSFCLWEGASSLDLLAMKYVTIVYALLLVLAVLLYLRKFSLTEKIMGRLLKQKANDMSIIHGLSGFLIMCYSQCTKVSLLILTPATVYFKGPVIKSKVSFYDGRLPFLKGSHLIYAIPAIISSLTLVMLPPLLFIIYPLCYRVFSFLHIQESTISRIACAIIPLEKFKPFFDSFQSSFKDEHRYFAGLYFLYRLITLMSFALFHELSSYYTAVQILLVLMLIVHAWVQPYKEKWHNWLDAGIIAVLAIINRLTQYNYSKAQDSSDQQITNISTVSTIQVTLAYFPLAYILLYCTWKAFIKLLPYWKKNKTKLLPFQKVKDELEMSLTLQEDREGHGMTSHYNQSE